MAPEPKTCASCGRTIEWRKKWERNWADVRYCSDACRKRKVRPVDRDLEITQRGQAVDPSTARGPIRIRRIS